MPRPNTLTVVPRLAAAGLVLTGGLIHLSLWSDGYRFIPSIGPLFLANAAVSALVAVLLVLSVDRRVVFAGLVLSVGSLVALALSRTVGLLGFMEGWNADSWQTIAAETGAIVAIFTALVARRWATQHALVPLPVRTDRRR